MWLICILKSTEHNLKLIKLGNYRNLSNLKPSPYRKIIIQENNEQLVELIKKHSSKLIYNSVVENKKLLRHGYTTNSKILKKIKYQEEELKKQLQTTTPLPLSLKYLTDENLDKIEESNDNNNNMNEDNVEQLTHFPFQIDHPNIDSDTNHPKLIESNRLDVADEAKKEVDQRYELIKEMKNWMKSYDNYNDYDIVEDEEQDVDLNDYKVNYGTPDPNSAISNIPCGGCGALLHCKDSAIPGYIPSEIFKNSFGNGSCNLQALICQRCHFLKYYNFALQMRVSPDDYPKVLQTVRKNAGLIILLVDLLDFPCSIWPGIADIFGNRVPIVVVGNKIDLLLQDDKRFIQRIRTTLLNYVKLSGFATLNIKHVELVSAKTGYGIEDLITRLQSLYQQKGDVYIVGCTNVGKSSLFNILIQSDYCKSQAIDLIQRATTSVWPGTTLNLLKFPIKRPAGYLQYLRQKRLEQQTKLWKKELELRKQQLKRTKNPEYASLIGHIDITRNPYKQEFDEFKDYFNVATNSNISGKFKMGLNEKSMDYAYSKWCYDTPGVVQPDQILHLLTAEELLMTLPKQLIVPRSFCLKPQMTLFIAGLSRLDFIEGADSVRLTVFTSNELPLTVCNLEDADDIYNNLLGTELFKVPSGTIERLSKWPKLQMAQSFKIIGEDWNKSVKDIVLSNSGWIAITGKPGLEYSFQAWTPEKRGVHLRDCLLPYAVSLKGTRLPRSVAYGKHKFYLK